MSHMLSQIYVRDPSRGARVAHDRLQRLLSGLRGVGRPRGQKIERGGERELQTESARPDRRRGAKGLGNDFAEKVIQFYVAEICHSRLPETEEH